MTKTTKRPLHRAAESAAEYHGWTPGNYGENRIALALTALRESPERCRQQHRVGRWRLDFAWPEQRVAIEADGWVHGHPNTQRRDDARDGDLLLQHGWFIFRIMNVELVAEQNLRSQCRAALWFRDTYAKRLSTAVEVYQGIPR